jgi:hypothetical protein
VGLVEVPTLLTPTLLSHADDCFLSPLLSRSIDAMARLPADPRAILGTTLHRFIELAAIGQVPFDGDPKRALRNALADCLAEKHRELASQGASHLVPLESTLPFPDYLARLSLALRMAERFLLAPGIPGRRSEGSTGSLATMERHVEAPDLRLVARIDRLEHRNGRVVVRDFKTGHLVDAQGQIRKSIARQMQLYGLLAHRLYPNASIELVLEGRDGPASVPFDAKRILDEHQRALSRLPPGTQRSSDLAKVGEHCRSCDARIVCPAYRSDTPAMWRAPSWRLPPDTWGTLLEPPRRTGLARFGFRLRDITGRHVSVANIDESHGDITELLEGAPVWFFALEIRGTSQTQRFHPVNFRELPDCVTEFRAFRAVVFSA